MLDKTKVAKKQLTPETQIILLRESNLESLIQDGGTFLTALGLTGIGWLIGSPAMSWIGFLAFCIIVMSWTKEKSYKIMTIKEARERLDQIEKDLA